MLEYLVGYVSLILTLKSLYANLNQEELVPKDQCPLYLVFDHLYNHQVAPERSRWKRCLVKSQLSKFILMKSFQKSFAFIYNHLYSQYQIHRACYKALYPV